MDCLKCNESHPEKYSHCESCGKCYHHRNSLSQLHSSGQCVNEGKAKTQMEEDEEEEGEEAGSQAEVFNSSHQRPEEEGHSRSRTTRRSSASKENEEEDGDDRETIDTPDGLYRDVVA